MAVNKTPAYLARLEKRKEIRLKAKLARENLKEEEKKTKLALRISGAPRS
jgi:hypothetical protein